MNFAKKIFYIIKPLVLEDDEAELSENLLPSRCAGSETHGKNDNSISGKEKEGRSQKFSTRLFRNLDNTEKNLTLALIFSLDFQKKIALRALRFLKTARFRLIR